MFNLKLVITAILITGVIQFSVANENEFENCCGIPHDKVISCDDLPFNFDPNNVHDLKAKFGFPKETSGCHFGEAQELSPIVRLNNCDIGTITRRFEIQPSNPWAETFVCEQHIEVVGTHDYHIKFPKDAQSHCSTPVVDNVVLDENACDLLSVSTNDERFAASGDECYKILRTYRVLNWCEFNEESDRPIIIGRDEDCDGIPGDEAVWVTHRGDGTVYIDADKDETNGFPSVLDPSCGHDGVPGYWRSFSLRPGDPLYSRRGFWQYTQVIKVFDNVNPTLRADAYEDFCSYDNVNCSGRADFSFSVLENCTPDDVEIRVFLKEFNQSVALTDDNDLSESVLSGTFPNFEISGIYPIGQHTFIVEARDGCGNTDYLELPFEVKDCVGPTPLCLELSTGLMPVIDQLNNQIDGMIVIWATDVVRSEIDDCNPPVTFSIHKQSAVDEGTDEPDPGQTNVTITCEDGPIVGIYVYAWDATGFSNRCFTNIIIGNQEDICATANFAAIAGNIRTTEDAVLENVEVFLSGASLDTLPTFNNGLYLYNKVEVGADYTITPYKNDDPKNGVNTMDLIRINRHILGSQRLDDPYLMIAADVNNSKTVTALDVIQIRKLILSLDTEFQDNTSWRFIDKSFEFESPEQPFEVEWPNEIQFEEIEDSHLAMDFVAVKIGDVNKDAVANRAGAVETRNENSLTFNMADQRVEVGETVEVPFYINQKDQLAGLQFTLKINTEQFLINQIRPSVLTELDQNFNLTKLEEGMFAFVWQTSDGLNFNESDAPLFYLEMTAIASTSLANGLSISSRITPAIGFSETGTSFDLDLQFKPGSTEELSDQEIAINPNPFKQQTSISFYQSVKGQTSVRVYAMDGKMVHQQLHWLEKGQQFINIDAEGWNAGIYIVKIEQAGGQLSAKMVLQ